MHSSVTCNSRVPVGFHGGKKAAMRSLTRGVRWVALVCCWEQDLVITKLVLEVDASYGPYTFCNVIDGAYICDCKWGKSGPVPCKPGVHPYLVGQKVIKATRQPKATNASQVTPHSRSKFWSDNARYARACHNYAHVHCKAQSAAPNTQHPCPLRVLFQSYGHIVPAHSAAKD